MSSDIDEMKLRMRLGVELQQHLEREHRDNCDWCAMFLRVVFVEQPRPRPQRPESQQ